MNLDNNTKVNAQKLGEEEIEEQNTDANELQEGIYADDEDND